MAQSNKMNCAECGAEMNHHAMKIDYSVDEKRIDPEFGGALVEAHTCPECGKTETRRAGS